MRLTKPPQAKRFSESAFRRYEMTIKEVVDRWPNPSIIRPTRLALETFAARMRDAIRAVVWSDWATVLDRDRVREVFSEAKIAIREDYVWVWDGSLETGAASVESSSAPTTVSSVSIPFVPRLITASATLLEHGVIEEVVLEDGPEQELLSLLADYDNVEYVRHNNYYIMV